jgi:hypothetical protein
MKNRIYQLKKDFSHLFDVDEDAALLPFEGSKDLGVQMQSIDKIDKIETLYFEANFEIIPEIDFPIPDKSSVLIFSIKMYNLIRSVGYFNHHTIPVVMLDDSYPGKHFESPGILKSDVNFNDQYIAVQFLEYTDAFDFEKSEYTVHPIFSDEVGTVSRFVLKNKQYPPIFRIEQKTRYVFITEEAKNKLLENGIKGCIFEEVEVSD